jgi:lipoprotein signal peptidase
MNFGRAFSYVTEDPQWLQKLGIAALIMIIPILGPITVIGWALAVTQHVIKGEPETPLNDWSNFGDYLAKGFQVFVIGFAFALPGLLVSFCQQGVAYLPSAMRDNQAIQTITSVVMVVTICFSCVSFIYNLLVAFVLPAAIGNFAATGQLGAAFRFNEVFGLVRAAPGAYFMVFLGSIVASIIAGLGLIACIIGVLFTAAYAYMINAHLWGQAYKAAKAMPAAPAVPSAM